MLIKFLALTEDKFLLHFFEKSGNKKDVFITVVLTKKVTKKSRLHPLPLFFLASFGLRPPSPKEKGFGKYLMEEARNPSDKKLFTFLEIVGEQNFKTCGCLLQAYCWAFPVTNDFRASSPEKLREPAEAENHLLVFGKACVSN